MTKSILTLLAGLLVSASVALPADARKIPGIHKAGDVTLKRGVIHMQPAPAKKRASRAARAGGHSHEVPLLSLSFSTARLQGDDLAITCRGALPSKVDVRVTHQRRGRKGRPLQHTVGLDAPELEFTVGTRALDGGTVEVAVLSEDASARVDSCTFERKAVKR